MSLENIANLNDALWLFDYNESHFLLLMG